MGTWSLFLAVVGITLAVVSADINMHWPRGSNNRLADKGRNVNGRTRQRLFDSENNDRSGYNEGSVKNEDHGVDMVHYANSQLIFEWANQHEANGNDTKKRDWKTHAKIVIQYMCHDGIRNGKISKKSPDQDQKCADNNCDTDERYGQHETLEYYKHCTARERHPELKTNYDNVNPNRKTARYTRQNPGGTRYGFECPEERDFYPYKGPSPWKDIAILTGDIKDCENNIQGKSQNTQDKEYCQPPESYMEQLRKLSDNSIRNKINRKKLPIIPATQEDCEDATYNGEKFQWKVAPNHGLNPPVCGNLPTTRINHNGNTKEGYYGRYNCYLEDAMHPDDIGKKCVFRMRYIIDSGDLDNNGVLDHVGLGFEDQETAEERGYIFENNPKVNIFKDIDMPLKLAINTAQTGRTFQDRSHKMKILPAQKDKVIHNLGVVGKRGNIVQVYPANEYRFIPSKLEVCEGDYIHFQWTGSNTNPRNNAGTGPAGTDRSNVILMKPSFFDTLHCDAKNESGCASCNVPNEIPKNFLGATDDDKWEMAVDALKSPYFEKLVQAKTPGEYNFLCTNNNNFSNRSQKGKIIVIEKGQGKCAAKKKRDSLRDVEKRFFQSVENFKIFMKDNYDM